MSKRCENWFGDYHALDIFLCADKAQKDAYSVFINDNCINFHVV